MGEEKNIHNNKESEEDDTMNALEQYLETDRKKAYSFATANTSYNAEGRPIILKDDEWINESEWDDLFDLVKNTKKSEK